MSHGSEKELVQEETISDDRDYIADVDHKADTIGVQIAGMDVATLVFIYGEWGQNGKYSWEEYLPIHPVD